MCTFITLIAATEELGRINAILATMHKRGQARRAERVETPNLRPLLAPDEREYWLTRAPCDCGTFLGHAHHHPKGPTAAPASDRAARYRRKGWSEARIARALAEQDRAAERPTRCEPNEDAAYWIDLMIALGEGLGLKRLGLMHHFYRKSPGEELDASTRKEGGPIQEAAHPLACMPDGVILDFTLERNNR
ncbi:MAG: hypothetical protein H9533_19950 [Rhodobacteraceae bacterium]|nr:hypothetical protein [Paracoccaceae bacterium]